MIIAQVENVNVLGPQDPNKFIRVYIHHVAQTSIFAVVDLLVACV
jgi:hypothetical protein